MQCKYVTHKVLHRIGLPPLLKIEVELDFRRDFKKDFPLIILPPRYEIMLYEFTKDLKGTKPKEVIDHGTGEGAFLQNLASKTIRTSINVPVSKKLIDEFNEIKGKGEPPSSRYMS